MKTLTELLIIGVRLLIDIPVRSTLDICFNSDARIGSKHPWGWSVMGGPASLFLCRWKHQVGGSQFSMTVAFIMLFLINPVLLSLSLSASAIATLLIPAIFILIKKDNILWMRIATGAQVAFIFIGWAAVQFPNFIQFKDGTTLSMYNAAAPNSTFTQMVIALTVGLLVVIPAFLYLFKIFKWDKNPKEIKS